VTEHSLGDWNTAALMKGIMQEKVGSLCNLISDASPRKRICDNFFGSNWTL